MKKMTDLLAKVRQGADDVVRLSEGALSLAADKARELARATANGEIHLRTPLVRIQPGSPQERQLLQEEYDRLRAQQAQIHRRLDELKRKLG